MTTENISIQHGAYTIFDVPSEHSAAVENIATGLPNLDLLANKERVIQHDEVEALILNGSLLRVDISGFSSLNDRLTSISPLETVPQRLAAFSLLNASRHQQALVYEDIAHQQAYLQASAGQQSLIDRFNTQFIAIEEAVAQYGGRILNIEGDAVNIYFPYIPEEFPDSGGSFVVHHRALTAGLEIQKLFPEESDLHARVGIRPTTPNEQALMIAGKLVYLTGKPFEELTGFEAGTTVGGVGTNLFDAGLLPAEVFYSESNNVDIWIQDAHQDGIKATLNPELVANWQYGGNDPFKKVRMHDGLFIAEVDPENFTPAEPIDPRVVSLGQIELNELLERFDRFKKKSIETPRNVPVIISYFAVGNIVKNNINETLTAVAQLDHLLSEIEKQYSVQMLKTGIDSHGNVTLIALHTGNRNGNGGEPGEIATVNAILAIENSLAQSSMLLSGAGIVSGSGVLTQMGAQFYRKDDIMGMAVTGAARIEQLIDRDTGRIAIDMATLGRLRALGYEPRGEQVVLQGVKGFPAGLPIFYLHGLDKAQESEVILRGNTFKGFKKNIKEWLKRQNLERNDLNEVFRLVQTYCGIHENDLTNLNADILRVILYPLLEDLRSGETLFHIHHTLAAESIKSNELQKELERIIEAHGEAVYLAAAMTGGSNLPFNKKTLREVASNLGIPVDKYLNYLKENKFSHMSKTKDQVVIWPALQRRAYVHLTDKEHQEQKRKYHTAIANYLQSQSTPKSPLEIRKALVFHAVQAGDDTMACEYLPQVVHDCIQDSDWEGVVLYGEWLAQSALKVDNYKNYAYARIRQGDAYVTFGDAVRARLAYGEALIYRNSVDPHLIAIAQIEQMYYSGRHPKAILQGIRKIQSDLGVRYESGHIDMSNRTLVEAVVRSYIDEAQMIDRSGMTQVRKKVLEKLQTLYDNEQLREQHVDLWLAVANAYVNISEQSKPETIEYLLKKFSRSNIGKLCSLIINKHPEYADIVASLLLNQNKFDNTMGSDKKMQNFNHIESLARRGGNFRRFMYYINNRADQIINQEKREDESTKKILLEGVQIAQAMGNIYFEANLRDNLGCHFLLENNIAAATEELGIAYRIFKEMGDTGSMEMVQNDARNIQPNLPDAILIVLELPVTSSSLIPY